MRRAPRAFQQYGNQRNPLRLLPKQCRKEPWVFSNFSFSERISESNLLLLQATQVLDDARIVTRLSSHPNVFESQLAHVGRLVNVAQVRDPWCLHQTANAFHVQGTKLIPLGYKDQHLSF